VAAGKEETGAMRRRKGFDRKVHERQGRIRKRRTKEPWDRRRGGRYFGHP